MKTVPGADIRTVNMRELTSGVLHTKFWVVDRKHIYIGSANMDWRSLTQVHKHTRGFLTHAHMPGLTLHVICFHLVLVCR